MQADKKPSERCLGDTHKNLKTEKCQQTKLFQLLMSLEKDFVKLTPAMT
jgi:hypothetical protein